MQRFTLFLLTLSAFGLAALASGCATVRGVDERVHFNPADRIVIYRDAWVQRNPPEVHVQPVSAAPTNLRVLFVPFRVIQPMDNSTILGYGTARIVWQTWLTMQLFPSLEFTGDEVPYRRDRAVQLGRARGADMVVGGFVTRVYAGGTAGATDLAIQLEAHDTRTGQLVWSMAQSGLMPASRTNDYFIFATRSRLPSDPLYAITQAIASDMGRQMQNWIAGPSPMTRIQEIDKRAHDVLFSRPDPVPAPRGHAEQPGGPHQSPGGAF